MLLFAITWGQEANSVYLHYVCLVGKAKERKAKRMPEIADHVAYLSQEIGPRPAGTEEEQQAALYITEQMQKDAGLSAVIEDFNGAPNAEVPRMICCACSVLVALASLFLPVMGVPSIIVSLAAALLFAAEAFDRPLLSRLFERGVSQNVVAKYDPGYTPEGTGPRRRKVILVARYDSGKVRSELGGSLVGILPALQWATLGAMVGLPVILVLRNAVFLNAEGALAVVMNVLTVLAVVLAAVPLAVGVLHKLASYNEAANSNAAGTAVLLEVARRVGRGRVSEAELAERENAAIHGEEAARAAGLVPEGADLVYEAQSLKPPEPTPQTPEARLAAAKAAVAALTGKPVSGMAASDIAQNLVQIKEPPLQHPSEEDFREQRGETFEAFSTIPPNTVQAALANVEKAAEAAAAEGLADAGASEQPVAGIAPQPMVEQPVSAATPSDGVPDWFKKAQEKAKRPRTADKPVQRSRYASALDAAVAESAGHFAEANLIVEQRLEQVLDEGREEIREIKAPQWGKNPDVADPSADRVASQEAVEQELAAAFSGERVQEGASNAQNAGAEGGNASDGEAAPGALPAVAAASNAVAAYEGTHDGSDGSDEPWRVSEQDGAAVAAGQDGSGDVSAAKREADPFSTTAMAPIDVSTLNIDDVPAVSEPSMPAFLDPRKVREEAEAARQDGIRTGNRVDVTDASIGASGRIEMGDAQPRKSARQPQVDAQQASQQAEASSRRPIVLPDIGVSAAKPAPITELPKQRAPLADVENAGKTAAKSLLTMLPSISVGDASNEVAPSDTAEKHDEPAKRKSSLLASLPSLSGAIARSGGADSRNSNVNAAGAFVPAGATGAFAPIGDELLENVDPDDIYVDDADDSAYDENFTETGAFAGPGYVEMPKSRVRRLFDRFRRKDKEDEASTQEWLDVDESFDARTVGAQRGGWESFREDGEAGDTADMTRRDAYEEPYVGTEIDQFEEDSFYSDDKYYRQDAYDEGAYDGEAYSEEYDGGAYDNEAPAGGAYEDEPYAPTDEGYSADDGRHRWNGGAFSSRRMESADLDSETLAEESAQAALPDAEISEELQQIYQFRNPDVNTEVWFVSLGSELAQNSGMRAFLAEHQQELRGAIIIELDSLGAGDLCMIEQEGMYKRAKTSSRMKRYIKKASQATGLSVGSARILWGDSSASYAIKHGQQAMHLVGMAGGKPAFFAQSDDVLENVDEDVLNANAGFVMELLKNI